MAEKEQKEDKPKILHILFIASLAALLIVIVVLSPSDVKISQSIDRQIQAIEAERFVPDEENAATIYKQLFADYNENDFNTALTGFAIDDRQFSIPWTDIDYPKAAEWLTSQQQTLTKLLEVCKKEKCYFPIDIDLLPYNPIPMLDKSMLIKNWTRLLKFAANNDAGEGRINEAIKKHACMLRMADHIKQQKQTTHFLVGIAIESLALTNIKTVILEADLTKTHLNLIGEFPLNIHDEWNKIYSGISKIDRLLDKKIRSKMPLHAKIQVWYFDKFVYSGSEVKIYDYYLMLISERRANRILIALRGYKNKNGKWPDNLQQLKPLANPEILIDPVSNDNFVYKLTDEGFTLYSKGLNNIDENGNYRYNTQKNKAEPDDRLIWPIE